jgi:hypothetical protein
MSVEKRGAKRKTKIEEILVKGRVSFQRLK